MRYIINSLFLIGIIHGANANTITHGSTTVSMDFVNMGNPENVADTTGYGSVGYNYQIGKYEVTVVQFSKALAADSRIGSGNENYWNDGTRTVGADAPVANANWYEAAKFCNWLTTGDALSGVYQFNGSGTLNKIDRSFRNDTDMAYVLPTEDEWYKAAYYKPQNDGSYSLFANGLDTAPIHGTVNGWNYNSNELVNVPPNYTWETGFGGVEQNGTYDMMGNVAEWTESTYSYDETQYITRGGDYGTSPSILSSSLYISSDPNNEFSSVGFRIAAIPEPSSIALLFLPCLYIYLRRNL